MCAIDYTSDGSELTDSSESRDALQSVLTGLSRQKFMDRNVKGAALAYAKFRLLTDDNLSEKARQSLLASLYRLEKIPVTSPSVAIVTYKNWPGPWAATMDRPPRKFLSDLIRCHIDSPHYVFTWFLSEAFGARRHSMSGLPGRHKANSRHHITIDHKNSYTPIADGLLYYNRARYLDEANFTKAISLFRKRMTHFPPRLVKQVFFPVFAFNCTLTSEGLFCTLQVALVPVEDDPEHMTMLRFSDRFKAEFSQRSTDEEPFRQMIAVIDHAFRQCSGPIPW